MILFTGGPEPAGSRRAMLVGAHLGAGLDAAIIRLDGTRHLFLFGEVDGAMRFGIRTPSTSPLVTGGYAALFGVRLEL
jgi:hypothetical protein